MQIDQWFPIHIGQAQNPFHKEIEDELTQQCLKIKKSYKKDLEDYKKENINNPSASTGAEWKLFQDTTSYKLLEDQKFTRLNNWVDDQVKEYTEKLIFNRKLNCVSGWFNVYEKYDYGDYHDHIPTILSCVYFLNCEGPSPPKLLIKNKNDALIYYCDPAAEGPLAAGIGFIPTPGKLIIFSSSLEHGVEQNITDNLRITLAYEYL